MEEFVTIEMAPLFEINRAGEIRYKPTGNIRTHQIDEKGYPYVMCALSQGRGSKYKKVRIHRALAVAFIPKEDESYDVVMHLNDNPSDYSLENLRWGTHKLNMEQSSKTGFYSTVKKEVTLLSPEGEVVHVRGLRTFCAEQGLDWGNFHKMVNKRVHFRSGKPRLTKTVKGWRTEK